ncbi:MAG TPA: type II toxin-antitoxin system RelE/ParE family toxin [Cyclobacteriaceae bacterium]|nr:type II toxin-antitoxin system RelE/ParE family toxin [Cyclobacteriaceae bacterium]
MVKVIWTELALGDLKAIHEYISKDSKGYANKFVGKLVDRVSQLQTFPKSGRIVPEYNSEILRELIEGNYRIVYSVHPDYIGIARIHHSARPLKLS